MCSVLLFRLPCDVLSDEMRLRVAAKCYQVSALLACRVVSPRSSTRGTGREAERTRMSGPDMRWEMVGDGELVAWFHLVRVIRMR